ncbi:ferritin-like protein [Ruegeria sp. HKCCD8929]|uniref:ferritin-like domain-containing protein n=1 Tax=Ruegeria sp. HKCCD8929 TaxID=2683006 RepID=UPI001487EAC9|nr:ferritin-like protein [Ruegeria sp. HKCCD8929]
MTRASDFGIRLRTIRAGNTETAEDQGWVEELELDLGPERQPRDQAALLLTVAAEIEHALMVQYLYAAYSIHDNFDDTARAGEARGIATRLIQIAREEMGHLISVQNLLHLIGAPVHFGRQHSPYASQLYPFRFKLEPVSKATLAKYVTAESPMTRPDEFDDDKWERVIEIAKEARTANDGQMVRHVGAIFEALIKLFEDPACGLKDADFTFNPVSLQARYDDWGYDPGRRGDTTRRVLVAEFTSQNAAVLRSSALEALKEISEQGEGFGISTDSHFQRFLEIYDDFDRLQKTGASIVRRLATNPSIGGGSTPEDIGSANLADALEASEMQRGVITNGRSRRWAMLFNLRYRLLLDFLAHYMRLDQSNYVSDGPSRGDRTPRGLLLIWAFDQMRHIKRIAEKLVTLPQKDPHDGTMAGPPFQLPFTLALPDIGAGRWRVHLDVVKASQILVTRMRDGTEPKDTDDPFLEDLAFWDAKVISILSALSAGNPVPDNAHPTEFRKVVQSLEEAVRGFSIDVHENFWTNRTRKDFVELHMFNRPIIASDPENDCRFTSEGSQLIGVLGRTMPRFRPLIPPERLSYIQGWIDRQAPDNAPAGQIGIAHERIPSPEDAPAVTAAGFAKSGLKFERDIAPMFRDIDRVLVKKFIGIDLNDPNDIRAHAGELVSRLEAGRLPYDANWPCEKIELFKHWIDNTTQDQE